MPAKRVGHIRQLPSKRWRWIAQHKGQRRSGTCETYGEAMVALAQCYVELGADHPASGNGSTVRHLLEAWRADRIDDWSPTYAADVENVVTRLPAAFLDRDIASVDPPIVVGLERQLRRAGWSEHRIRRAHNALSAAWKLAVGYGWAPVNPLRDLPGPNIPEAQVRAPDDAAVNAILEAASDQVLLFLRLAAITGARRGELVALQWRDVEVRQDGATVTIRRTVVYSKATGVVVREQTKTGRKGDRRLPLDEDTAAMLVAHRAAQADEAAAAAEHGLDAPLWIFSHDAGQSPWRPDYISRAHRFARERADVGRVRLHDLRHYVITTMLADGEPLLAAAHQAGHASPTTTGRRYAHYLPALGEESAVRRAGRLRK